MKKILIINGPNLNMLGTREPEVYGHLSLDEIIKYSESKVAHLNVKVDWFQSNAESEIIEKIQNLAKDKTHDAIIVNPGAFSHTSIAILDALLILTIPIIEVHLSQVYKREAYRQNLLTAKASQIIMSGAGKESYHLAIYAIASL